MSTIPSLGRARRLSYKSLRSDRAILCLLLRVLGSIGSALIMICRLLRRNWSILRLRYAPVFSPLNTEPFLDLSIYIYIHHPG